MADLDAMYASDPWLVVVKLHKIRVSALLLVFVKLLTVHSLAFFPLGHSLL